MPNTVKPIPEGYHSLTPGLCVVDSAKAIEFYKKAFGAVELMRMPGAGGKIMHAELKIGDSILFLSDECPEMANSCSAPQTLKGSTAALYLYVTDVDKVFAQAAKAGAKVNMALTDMFWGDRYCQVQDPFGHIWAIATRNENLTPAQVKERQDKFFSATAK